jgi:transcriptional regulator with XRE-family HTH domain
MLEFSKKLKEFRKAKGLSQDELASIVGVHKSHMSRYERGLAVPSLEVAQKLANALSVSLNEMIAQNYDFEKDRELSQLFEQTTQLEDFDKKVVKALLSAFLLKKEIQSKLEEDM